MHNSAVVASPITGKSAKVIASRNTHEIINLYKEIFDIDISRFFINKEREILLCQCNESGYKFYYPANIVGDSDFYHRLEKNYWYYMPIKWEFEESINHFTGGAILEIGSAKGDFLAIVQQSYPDAELVGLELNKEAAKVANIRGFDVRLELSSDHVKSNKEKYDVVASFQVLEHISSPMDLLKDAVEMLKPGGKLIIGVPDNSIRATPSLFVTIDNILNMPPHHQGIWDISSLSYLIKILPLRLEYIATEPANANHHSNSYRGLMKQDLMRRFGKYVGYFVYLIGRPYYNHALKHLNKYLPAHSILVVFEKMPQ